MKITSSSAVSRMTRFFSSAVHRVIEFAFADLGAVPAFDDRDIESRRAASGTGSGASASARLTSDRIARQCGMSARQG